MVHTFTMHNTKIAYDANANAIYELDALADAVLQQYKKNDGMRPERTVLDSLINDFNVTMDELAGCADDFDELINNNALFAQPIKVDLSSLYPEPPAIKAMCLHICHDCNLRCRYCFAGTGDYGEKHRSMLREDVGKDAIDFLIAASQKRVHLDLDFFGGEPLMNWPVVEALTHYCEKRGKETGKKIRLTLTTNALGLDDKKTEFINEHIKNCVLSMDGRPAIHNRMRPLPHDRPSYDLVSKRIKAFIKKRIMPNSRHHEYYVRGTFTRHNLDFDQDVFHMADQLLARHISIEPVVAHDQVGYELRHDDVKEICASYERLANMLFERHRQKNPVSFFHFASDPLKGPCVYKRLKGCGVGTEYCAVTPAGDIYPCHQFVGKSVFKMGNVKDIASYLDDKRQLMPKKDIYDILHPVVRQRFIDRLVPQDKTCQTCFARYHCGGGCMANAFHATGSLDGLYELGCELAKKRLECTLWLTVAMQRSKEHVLQ